MRNDIVIIRGGGDIASGTVQKLHRCGFKVLVLEVKNPTSIRRLVSFSEAIYEGKITIEGITAVYAKNMKNIYDAWINNRVPIMVDPHCNCLNTIRPKILVDAILAKKNLGTNINMADITIGLGPGFKAGDDVNAVVETMRGHNLGRVIYSGCAMADTGCPGSILGFSKERVIYSPCSGIIKNIKQIGDLVKKGSTIALVDNVKIKASLTGVLRGIIRDNSTVFKGLKIADIDPRASERKNCFTISDKARNIAGGVLEAILYLQNNKSNVEDHCRVQNIKTHLQKGLLHN
ncbi:selenium-dependent molybdenum cofactor biosynthesis protein YqeB [Clostridium sp. MT-14]|uniref:EF2563 family selenium-dependent molybdenum hydroxylase system protein n=1 Tax=Clostridium aromativorans TaxID=2836848 RepID=A0ABS8N604_9CLOT|nr:selenium-dependent molybdenum cofactor biosynthesis protein YqeB [Clostridium aromativorans]MCC9294500.1 EF2563 family selenium-dependent molybdenum hydroxylase system protein [Clostridium aromativorans]CAB1254920.1 Xanthine and CO dehydrogenases maturation factor, XdhC/CoxF family [Clostridiaceae bacterium BL-3]